jgi:hypothetical protein
MSKEQLVAQIKKENPRTGSLQHSLLASLLQGGRKIDACTKCLIEVHASLTCTCGKQAETFE